MRRKRSSNIFHFGFPSSLSSGITTGMFFMCFVFLLSCRTTEESSCIYDPVNSNVRNFPHLLHHKKPGLNIADGMFKGLLEYLPKEYNAADSTKKYPVIIYFHGYDARGEGTSYDLCKILWDGITGPGASLPPLIEGRMFPESVRSGGQEYSFVVISPQFTHYLYPSDYPTVEEVDAIVDYVVDNYRVDPSRVYLTGMSTGANMVIEYAGSRVSRGKIAAVSTSSLCDSVSVSTNINRDITPANVVANDVGLWLMQCTDDERCSADISRGWYNQVVAAGGKKARLTILDNNHPNPMFHCARYEHNTWFKFYDPGFRQEGMNLYEWFLQFRSQPPAPIAAP